MRCVFVLRCNFIRLFLSLTAFFFSFFFFLSWFYYFNEVEAAAGTKKPRNQIFCEMRERERKKGNFSFTFRVSFATRFLWLLLFKCVFIFYILGLFGVRALLSTQNNNTWLITIFRVKYLWATICVGITWKLCRPMRVCACVRVRVDKWRWNEQDRNWETENFAYTVNSKISSSQNVQRPSFIRTGPIIHTSICRVLCENVKRCCRNDSTSLRSRFRVHLLLALLPFHS